MPYKTPSCRKCRRLARAGLLSAITCTAAAPAAFAVEGGTGAYLLGSRDTFAGIAPPPGSHVSLDVLHLDATAPFLPIGGVILNEVTTSATVAKFNFTQSFRQPLWGGQAFVTLTIPVVSGDLSFAGELTSGLSGGFTDKDSGFGDITLTPALGFHSGPHHWVYAASIFAPTGYYEPATVNIPARQVQALSFGKNRWAVMPAVAYTYFNPASGFEVSAVGGVTFSQENEATHYQTAPEASFEAAVLQHLPSGWAFGLTGYAYQQIGDDTGPGADLMRAVTNAKSLEASVQAAGPIVTYSTKIDGRSVSFKLKYLSEFDARRRFEADVVVASVSLSF